MAQVRGEGKRHVETLASICCRPQLRRVHAIDCEGSVKDRVRLRLVQDLESNLVIVGPRLVGEERERALLEGH